MVREGMGYAPQVPEGPRNGSRAHAAALAVRLFHTAAPAALFVACLQGQAEPIVALGDDAGVDVTANGPERASCDPTTAPLVLYYRNTTPAQSTGIDFLFKVANHTRAALPLTSLSVRYYFVNVIAPPGQTAIFYADTCCADRRVGFTADVAVSVVALAATAATADHYLEITFDAGAGTVLDGDAVQVEVAFHAPGYTQSLNQSNDYSFLDGAMGTQAAWDQCPTQCAPFGSCVMTVYRDGVLVWGTPP
jgi:hypothetical protein